MRDHPLSSRIRLSRAAGWRMPPNTIRADRSTVLGNPWIAGDPARLKILAHASPKGWAQWDNPPPLSRAMTVEEVVAVHRAWLDDGTVILPEGLGETARHQCADTLSEQRNTVLAMLARMRGCDFGCWCQIGAPCHADTLMEIANG